MNKFARRTLSLPYLRPIGPLMSRPAARSCSSRNVTDGYQALTIHNNSATPLMDPQVVYSYAVRPGVQSSEDPALAIDGPSLRLDPKVGLEGCPDQATEQFITKIDVISPWQETDVDIPASPKGDAGEDVYFQFQESNERGQWWELRIGRTTEKIAGPFAAQPGSPCFTGRVSFPE